MDDLLLKPLDVKKLNEVLRRWVPERTAS
jgi:response regulator of citrate/malate metabolism